jgi:hypothetical protein
MRLNRPWSPPTATGPSRPPTRRSTGRTDHHRRGTRPFRSACTTAVTVAALCAACAVILVAAATPALAADTGMPAVAIAASVGQVLTNLRNWLMGILAALATVFLTIGGVRYLMAGGDPGEVEAAKRAFKSAGWGYVGAALAPLIVTILSGIVGA